MAADYLEFGIGLSEAITLDLVYGRTTAVDENNVRTFADNTSGTATATGSGDAEKLRFKVGQNRETEDIDTSGIPVIVIQKDKYDTGFGSITVKYKTAATQAGLTGEGWTTYTVPFSSSGWIKVRVET
jgi:Tfp pilus assembly protein FimT